MESPADTAPTPEQLQSEYDKRVGREISFGIQQTLACWATDFIDPYVSQWFQNKYGNQDHHVTAGHTWGGELIGDSSAFFAYMLAKRTMGKPIDSMTAGVKSVLNPFYDRMGDKSLKAWAQAQHIAKDDPRYRQKLEEYKQFQAENAVDSVIIAGAATGLNIVTQRALGNRQKYSVILASKLIGAAATITAMLGLRTAIPQTTKTLDDELSERYFSKVVRFTKKAFGVKNVDAEQPDAFERIGIQSLGGMMAGAFTNAPLAEVTLTPDKRTGLTRMLCQHAEGRDLNDNAQLQHFLADEKRVIDAMIDIFNPDGTLAQALTQKHHDITGQMYAAAQKSAKLGEEPLMTKVSMESVQSILINRRDDLLALSKMLADPAFVAQVAQKAASGELNAPRKELTPEKKEKLLESLLQLKGSGKAEPAVHIFAHAKGQLIEHEALAVCFDPEGSVTKQFADELCKRLPDMDRAKLGNIAKNYMADRQFSASQAAEAFKLDGEIVTEAVRRSESIRHRVHPAGDSRRGLAAH